MQCLFGSVGHHIGVQDFQLCHRAFLALEITLCLSVFYTIHLTVIVPDGFCSHFQDMLFQQGLPSIAPRWAGEVHKSSWSAPPTAVVITTAVWCFYKGVVFLKPLLIRMPCQDARLEIYDDIDASGIHLVKELFRLWEAFFIPVEHIAQVVLFPTGIPRCQPKVIDRDLLFFVLIDNFINFFIAVLFQFCIIHGGGTISQGLLGGQGGSAGQLGIAVDDLRYRGTVEQEQIYIAAIGLIVARDFLSHVKHTIVGIVVEKAGCMLFVLVYTDIERDMLIHRVTGLRVMADCILRGHAHPTELFIQMAGFLTKAKEMIFCTIHAGIMAQTPQLVPLKGTFFQISVQRVALYIVQRKTERLLVQYQFYCFGGKSQVFFRFRIRHHQGRDPGAFVFQQFIHAVRPCGHNQRIGFFFHGGPAVKVYANTDYIIRHKNQQHSGNVPMDQVAIVCRFDRLILAKQHSVTSLVTYQSGQTVQRIQPVCSPVRDWRT